MSGVFGPTSYGFYANNNFANSFSPLGYDPYNSFGTGAFGGLGGSYGALGAYGGLGLGGSAFAGGLYGGFGGASIASGIQALAWGAKEIITALANADSGASAAAWDESGAKPIV